MASSADARIDAQALRGRVAVVTGGSRGIGAAVASVLARHGARVLAVSRSGALTDAAAAPVEALAADVATEDGIAALERHAMSPDIVVHSAGAFALAPLADTSVAAFDRMMAVNLRAAFLLARAFLPDMTRRGSGHFVSIGSVAGRVALAGNAAYAASKFGLRGLHAVLDVELRGSGVRATLVEPSATSTALWDGVDGAGYDLPPREAMLDAAAVADAVLYAVTRPEGVAIPNLLIGRG
jgi:NAD(P)-dependent dehydrogenase (short-subunit alcohol dehydrogenase family)